MQLFRDAQVRMSPDNMTAFILWDAHDDSLFSAEREISYRSEPACGMVESAGLLRAYLTQWPYNPV